MSSTLTDLTAATTWSGTDLFYAAVGANSRKIAASSFFTKSGSIISTTSDLAVGASNSLGWHTDTFLKRETGGNILTQVNSTNAQTFRLYRTFTDSSNYERLTLTTLGANVVSFIAETAGTGNDDLSLTFTAAGAGFFTMNGVVVINTTVAATNSISTAETVTMTSTGTTAAGFGLQINYQLENASGSLATAGRLICAYDDATAASENSNFQFNPRKAGSVFTALKVDATVTATQTALLIFDVDNNTLERVSVGAADSGGAGFKLLRIAN